MFTPYAVMSWNDYDVTHRLLAGADLIRPYDRHCRTRMLNKKWLTYKYVGDDMVWSLTTEGKVAFELRRILGPDRELTKAQAGHLVKYGIPMGSAMMRKLTALGLIRSDEFCLRNTEDGERVRALLVRYGVSL